MATTEEPEVCLVDDYKLQILTEDEGFSDPMDLVESCYFGHAAPGICMNEHCHYSTKVEPDSKGGWCEICDSQTVVSVHVLAGMM